MPADLPIRTLDWAAYRIPTDAPEADGTFAWAATTMVVVHARAGGETGLGWTYGAAVAGHLIDEVGVPPLASRVSRGFWGDFLDVFRHPALMRRSGPAEDAQGEGECRYSHERPRWQPERNGRVRCSALVELNPLRG